MSDDLVKQAIAELQDLVRFSLRHPDPACECDNVENVKVVADRIEELEAKLAKAVEVLSFASNVDTADWSEALDVRNQARATLAEIKGGNDAKSNL